jgi:uncharacterized protein YlxW (UPF0749 family)
MSTVTVAGLILGFIGAIGGLSGFFVAIISRKKVKAETEGTLVKAAKDVVNIAMDQLAVLEKELKNLRQQTERLNQLVEDYRAQILVAAEQAKIQVVRTSALEERVRLLEEVLQSHGVPIPNGHKE